MDIFACSFLCVMPHDGGMLIVTQLAGTSPLDVMKYCYYVYALLIAACITISWGHMRGNRGLLTADKEGDAESRHPPLDFLNCIC